MLIYNYSYAEKSRKRRLVMKSKIISLIIFIFLLTGALFIPINAAEATDSRITASMEAFSDTDGRIIGTSSKGEWDNYPENSIPAIEEAAKTDIDFVLIDIKKTSDGRLIAFSDDTTARMLASDTVYTVADTDYATLSKSFLRNSCGGMGEKASEYKIPLLSEVIDAAKENDIPLILRCEADIIAAVSDKVSAEDAHSMCIIMTDASAKEIKTAISQCKDTPKIIGSKKGNVIFVMNSYVNKTDELGALGVDLKTGNRYGINYYKSVVGNYASKMRVIADPTTPEICGARQDSEKWWNDLISRGYSVIITDHAELFCEYLKRNSSAREELTSLYKKHVTDKVLPEGFDKIMLNDYKKAYTDAVSAADEILKDNSASLQDINDCSSALIKASNDISIHFDSLEDGSSGTTITVPRIILCVLAVAVVVIVQIYFFRRRRKV